MLWMKTLGVVYNPPPLTNLTFVLF
jgi:hypothetical protein